MQRTASVLRALPAHMARRARAGQMDRMRYAAATVATAWPPACPLSTINADANRPEGSNPSSSESLSLMDDEDDDTRFRFRKDGDRGPIRNNAGRGISAIREGVAIASEKMKATNFRGEQRQQPRQSRNTYRNEDDGDFTERFPVDSSTPSLTDNINDVVYNGPVMDALVLPSLDSIGNSEPKSSRTMNLGVPVPSDRVGSPEKTPMGVGATGSVGATLGRIVPLDENDAKKLSEIRKSTSGPVLATPEEVADATKRAVAARRVIRATYTPEQAANMSRSLIAQHGRDLEPVPLKAGAFEDNVMAIRTKDDWDLQEDPLYNQKLPFNMSAVTMVSSLTWNTVPNSQPVDTKATLSIDVNSLGLDKTSRQYLTLVAGSRFNKSNGRLVFTVNKHHDAASNKREALELLVKLVEESSSLAQKFGPCKQSRPVPAYCH